MYERLTIGMRRTKQDVSFATSAVNRGVAREQYGQGTVVDQGLEFSVWLGVAVVALIWANLLLWRTRHTLKQMRQDLGVPDGRLVPDAIAMPAEVPEMAAAVTSP